MQPHLFIFGLGYSSQAIAKLAMKHGFRVSGTTRDVHKAAALNELGIEVFNPHAPADSGFQWGKYTYILNSIPPNDQIDPLARIPDVWRGWLGYLSTTGVYGDWGGEWVDEASELRPNNARLRNRVAAENAWRERGGHVFRIAGIYGPTRSTLDDILAGQARRIDKANQVFSRIHVDDIAQTVVASMIKPSEGTTYNVCDDMPAPAHEVVAYGCGLLGVKPPPLIPWQEAEMSPMGKEFYAANRRVRNDKIKQELAVSLYYPTYKEGLAQCLQQMDT